MLLTENKLKKHTNYKIQNKHQVILISKVVAYFLESLLGVSEHLL